MWDEAGNFHATDPLFESDILLVTTDTIPGHTIEKVLGLVRSGAPSSAVNAEEGLIEQAQRRGANAVVGLRYACGEWLVVYGTAVVVRPQ
jgi:uncharacterized protein YbjQ (UPF0145 family)